MIRIESRMRGRIFSCKFFRTVALGGVSDMLS